MPGKKAHKPRDIEGSGTHGVHGKGGHARKSEAQTVGQFERDPKRRTGQYTGAGNPALTKK
jgi:hypothetical protein